MHPSLPCLLASGEEIAMTMFICMSAVLIAYSVAHSIRKMREAAYTARLKQLMIERGMSAADIDQIVRARMGDRPDVRGIGGWFCKRDPVI